jgi:Predicted xylanase/chitin deacetylase
MKIKKSIIFTSLFFIFGLVFLIIGKEVKKPISNYLYETKVEQVINTKNNNINNRPIVTYIDDDADPIFKEIWQPILKEKGIKIGLAVIVNRVGKKNSLSLEELHNLQEEGNDIYSHGMNHLATYSTEPEILDTEFKDSQQWMKDNGFLGFNVLVYPGGILQKDELRKDVAKKYYDYGIIASGGYETDPIDNWAIKRINGDTSSYDEIKTAIDTIISKNSWLIIMDHAYELNKDRLNNINKINQTIDYCKTKNVPIMPFSEAIKYFEIK